MVYAAFSLSVVFLTWMTVSALGLHGLYVRLAAVVAFVGLPMVLGLSWAVIEPDDPARKGFIVRDD